MKRILIECGHERNRNAGDEAYFASMVDQFRSSLGNIEITTFSDRIERDKERYGVKTIYSGGTPLKTLKSFFSIVQTIKRNDIYIWGAGQILRDDTGLKSPLYRLSRPFIAKLLGKPVMSYAAGIGPLESTTARFLAKRILNLFDVIAVRDEHSRRLLEQLGIHRKKIFLTADPAFALEPASPSDVDDLLSQLKIDGTRTLLGVAPFGPAFRGVRSILPAKYQMKFNMWKPGGEEKYKNHVQIMADFLDHIIETYEYQLVFIAQDASWQGADDRISEDIISLMSNQDSVLSINADDFAPKILKAFMGRMKAVIGGRMHSLILASGIGTPVLGVCFENKIKTFGSIIDQKDYFVDANDNLELQQLMGIFDSLLRNEKEIRKALVIKMQYLKKLANENTSLLKHMLYTDPDIKNYMYKNEINA